MMRKLGGLAIAAVLAAPAFAATPAASAATGVGSECTANLSGANVTLTQASKKTGSLPLTVPSPGVVTSWRVDAGGVVAGQRIEYLKVFRETGKPHELEVVAESVGGALHGGVNTIAARIPVQAGDRFGAYSPEGTLYCSAPLPPEGDTVAIMAGNVPVGATAGYGTGSPYHVAVSAAVEPDADNDGYGDETQDKCPPSAQYFEIACPSLTLSFFSIAQRTSALVYVSAGVPSQITVSAKVAGVPAKKRAGSSATIELRPVSHLANPGQITKYKLKFPGPLKAALANLPHGKSLALKVKASGANLAGVVKSEERTLRLKGQG